MTHPQGLALVEEATKKAAIAWISVNDGPATALWCLPIDGGIATVVGPGEQALAGLAEAATAQVTLRGDHGGGLISYPAQVTRLRVEMEQWGEVVPQLASKRLNAVGTAEEVAARWERDCAVLTLTPLGETAALPDTSGAAEPRPSEATTLPRKPFKLHRVPRKRA